MQNNDENRSREKGDRYEPAVHKDILQITQLNNQEHTGIIKNNNKWIYTQNR